MSSSLLNCKYISFFFFFSATTSRMIEITSCFSNEALNFSTPSCSFGSTKSSYISPSPSHVPSIRNAVVYVYRTDLPSRKTQFLITVTWCMAPGGPRLIVKFGHSSDKESPCVRIGTSPRMFGRSRGRKRVECQNSRVVVSWDFSKARFIVGSPELAGGFYVTVSVDSELGLALGDEGRASKSGSAKSVLVSKREELFGDGLYSTGSQFGQDGDLHDILIKCRGGEHETEQGNNQQRPRSTLHLYVDKKLVVRVKRLQWNFRGRQTIFVDGLAVDFMWNVHDWFDNLRAGQGVFMFRTRNESENVIGITSDEKIEMDEGDGFSLLICASKNPS